VVVITSDNYVKSTAERSGAVVFSSQDFIENLFGTDLDEDYDFQNIKRGNPKKTKKKDRLKQKFLKKL
ncbi:MAG: NYN domain-containing protein, partial [Proteobacteria bacterium]|nr:NYN domain-containing protein [Pseudomonadota bacterium]